MKRHRSSAFSAGIMAVAMAVAGLFPAKQAQAQAFSPTSLNGCALWLRAEEGVVTSGGKVTTWQDQSGNNRNASQGIAPDTPTLVASALNGQDVIRFDGSNDGLSLGNIGGAFPTQATLFVVSTINYVGGWDDMYNLVTTGVGANPYFDCWWRENWLPLGVNSAPNMFRSAGNRINTYPAPPSNGSHVFAVESSSGKWEMWVDGNGYGAVSPNDYYSGGNEYRIGMPDNVTIPPSWDGQAAKFLNGDIAEIIIYNRVLTEAERNQVGFYLSERYGLSTTYEEPPPPLRGALLILR